MWGVFKDYKKPKLPIHILMVDFSSHFQKKIGVFFLFKFLTKTRFSTTFDHYKNTHTQPPPQSHLKDRLSKNKPVISLSLSLLIYRSAATLTRKRFGPFLSVHGLNKSFYPPIYTTY